MIQRFILRLKKNFTFYKVGENSENAVKLILLFCVPFQITLITKLDIKSDRIFLIYLTSRDYYYKCITSRANLLLGELKFNSFYTSFQHGYHLFVLYNSIFY